MKLTLKTIATVQLPAGKTDHVFWDEDIKGFGLRIRQGGSRVYLFRYRVGKQQYSIVLGSLKERPLAEVRESAARLKAEVRLGRNPALQKETARLEAGVLFGPLADQYLDARAADLRPSTLRNAKHYLLKQAQPLHRIPINAITLHHVADLLGGVAKKSGRVSANRLQATLGQFFTWVRRQGIVLPHGNVAAEAERYKEQTRERVLADAELRAIWHALGNDDHSTILKLLTLTGCRASEIGALRWDEVQGDQIILPGTRTKNARVHVVPLSPLAEAILDALRMHGRVCVFGRTDRDGFKGWGKPKLKLDAEIAKANGGPLPHWTVHDLRRTVATGLQRLGTRLEVTEAVLNHKSGSLGGVAGIYQRHDWAAEKRQALERWAEHVLAIVG